ncbi:hypothetical protein NX059_011631 [Plenodomus lindquistii]|nr:hypothetical protein NX059_011631 [Plenodomus lindquistii]
MPMRRFRRGAQRGHRQEKITDAGDHIGLVASHKHNPVIIIPKRRYALRTTVGRSPFPPRRGCGDSGSDDSYRSSRRATATQMISMLDFTAFTPHDLIPQR